MNSSYWVSGPPFFPLELQCWPWRLAGFQPVCLRGLHSANVKRGSPYCRLSCFGDRHAGGLWACNQLTGQTGAPHDVLKVLMEDMLADLPDD